MGKFTEEEKNEMREGAKEVIEAAEAAVKEAAEAAKPVADKVKEAAKPVAKRVKKATEEVAEAAKPVTKRVKKAAEDVAKEAAKKTPAKPEVFVQYQGMEIATADLIQDARTAYKAAGNRSAVRSLQVYVKPEDGAAYFVVNGEFHGKIDL